VPKVARQAVQGTANDWHSVHCQQQEAAEAYCERERCQVEQAPDQNGGQALAMPVPEYVNAWSKRVKTADIVSQGMGERF
jgi:hypothetical protein